MKSDLPRHKRSVPIYRALAGLLIPKEVLVYTPEEIEAWKDVPQAFITAIVKRGGSFMRRSKADLVRGWLEKARRDLKVALDGLSESEPFTDIVCFQHDRQPRNT